MVEMETASLERSRERQMVWSALSKTTRVGCTLFKTVEGGSSLRNVEIALYRWSWVSRRPMRVRHDWDGCRCRLDDRKIVNERFDEHLLPLSLYQANCDIAWMFSWYSVGYGWLVMAS